MLRTTLVLMLAATPAFAAPSCPTAVTDAIAKAFPKSKIDRCKSETEKGVTQFEVRLTKADAKKVEVDVAADGKILQIEEKIAPTELPDAVKKAFAAKYPKAKAERAEKQTAGSDVSYEIAFGTKEATFKADGTFVEEEGEDRD
ncbi:MAG: PepSY-like domain-containing protein [Deltaproteobacteria bacterium]|nr:PepSY-like domain-containing protein [Deltaproteobacteria bacterium]